MACFVKASDSNRIDKDLTRMQLWRPHLTAAHNKAALPLLHNSVMSVGLRFWQRCCSVKSGLTSSDAKQQQERLHTPIDALYTGQRSFVPLLRSSHHGGSKA
eukprot:3558766-Amphidinium_carterae.1